MKNTYIYLSTTLFLMFSLSGCNRPGSNNGEVTLNVTQAYQTVEARLTESSEQTPAPKETDTQPSLPSETAVTITDQPTATQPATQPPFTQTPAKKCDQAAAGVPIDVTIPDDSELDAGQSFTKTWRLQNVGTCTWTKDYTISLFSGDAMNAPSSVALPNKVDPGQSVDISVDLVAPLESGTYQGNWKLKNANNEWFGIGPGGGSVFWVRIAVKQSITGTLTPSTSETPDTTTTPSDITTTPWVHISGSGKLSPGDTINLDNLAVNSGSGDDLNYVLIEQQDLMLAPLGSSRIGIYGDNTPDFNTCQATSLSNASLSLNDLYSGINICFQTEKGRYGYLQLIDLNLDNFKLNLQITTWSPP